jgi:hypothetical protein
MKVPNDLHQVLSNQLYQTLYCIMITNLTPSLSLIMIMTEFWRLNMVPTKHFTFSSYSYISYYFLAAKKMFAMPEQ